MYAFLIGCFIILILLGQTLTLIFWSFWLASNTESNCLFYALMKFRACGGYLIMRKSRHGWFPHFLWSANLKTFSQFVPRHPVKGLKCPPVFFAGIIRTGSRSMDFDR